MPPAREAVGASAVSTQSGSHVEAADSGLSAWATTWVQQALGEPTVIQREAWPVLATGQDAVLIAPTGSGKTLAAFLAALDSLAHTPPADRKRVLYISPLKALASDIERNLRSPLIGLEQIAARSGVTIPPISVGIRTGDTPQSERTRQAKNPPDVWITTPESLFLLLTSRARDALRDIDTVIIDEVHALADSKRGAHLAVSLERLDALLPQPAQRIALSATVTPISEVARYVRATDPAGVAVISPAIDKQIELTVESPVLDFRDIGHARTDDAGVEIVTGSAAGDADRSSVWPAIADRVLDIITAHRSTIVFVNSRRLAERLTARLNDAAAQREEESDQSTAAREATVIARAHHGSVSKDLRRSIEEDLKAGRLPAVVATSSMELGIDMGAVDVVVQIQSPTSVASGLQRVGRAGHGVGEVSRGHVISTHAHDLLLSISLADRMSESLLEPMRLPSLPLDVLSQQIVAMCAMDDWTFDDLAQLIRKAASFTHLSDALLTSVVNMLAGTYPSERFAELRPRLVWDRTSQVLTGRPGAGRLAVTNAGTIPDRGLFGVHVATEGFPRVGELDEEMVYETRVGEVITLGASTWQVQEITHDRVLVTPTPGAIGRMPFWHGDSAGRPAQLAEAIGHTIRSPEPKTAALQIYLDEQQQATGVVPDDRNLLIEAFRDDIGDWRVVLHSPYGAKVHSPLALVLAQNLRDRLGIDPQVMHADDGIVIRLPDYVHALDPVDNAAGDSAGDVRSSGSDFGGPLGGTTEGEHVLSQVVESLDIDTVGLEQTVQDEVSGSALFAARFRECAGRSLLLPRRRPDRRSPLWQQRQRANALLQVAADYPDFPIVLETMRECLHDVYDLPGLSSLLERIHSGDVSVTTVTTDHPSPFARSLLFGYVATFMYEGDAPLAERRAQALSIDTELLADLLGTSELRSLLDAEAIAEVEDEVSFQAPHTRARSLEDAADLLRLLGPLDTGTAQRCGVESVWLDELVAARRAITVTVGGRRCWAAIEDAGRLRDALGVVLPPGIPDAHLVAGDAPLEGMVHRFARTHGPFRLPDVVEHFGLPVAVVESALNDLLAQRSLLAGEFRPGGHGREFCDPEVLRRIRRRSVARLREEIEPVGLAQYAAFLPRWHGVLESGIHESNERELLARDVTAPPEDTASRGTPEMSIVDAVDRLSGLVLPASSTLGIIRSRVPKATLTDLDALLTTGDLTVWSMGEMGSRDARIAWAPAPIAAGIRSMLRGSHPTMDDAEYHELKDIDRSVLNVLVGGGAFLGDSVHASLVSAGTVVSMETVEATLWQLFRAGWISCDSWSFVHARVHGRKSPRPRPRTARAGSTRRRAAPLPRRTRLATTSGATSADPRWFLAPGVSATEVTDTGSHERIAAEYAGLLLERWAVVTRTAVASEEPVGGFAGQYPVLSTLADAGICQRIYAIEGAGGAQFALADTVDAIRDASSSLADGSLVTMLSVDPANPCGSLVPWPEESRRASRRAGSIVARCGTETRAWLDPNGSHLEAWGIDTVEHATAVLAALSRARAVLTEKSRATLTTVNAQSLIDAPTHDMWNQAARSAGLFPVPRGWRWESHAGR